MKKVFKHFKVILEKDNHEVEIFFNLGQMQDVFNLIKYIEKGYKWQMTNDLPKAIKEVK